MPSRWENFSPFIPALRADGLEGQTHTTAFHYLTLEKSVVCRCNDMRHSGCRKVQNDDIQTWSECFFHYNPEEITCNREQWRAYSHGPPQNPQAADRKYSEGVPDADELFDLASAKFRSAYASGLSSYHALDVTKTYMFELTGWIMTSRAERMLLSLLPTDSQARKAHEDDENTVVDFNMQEEFLYSLERRRSVPTSCRTNPSLRSQPGAPPGILKNLSNSATPRSAPVSGQRNGGFPTPTQSHPKSPSPQHDQGVSSRSGDDDATTACLLLVLNIVPHADPQLILSLIDETVLCQRGILRYSDDIINRLLDTPTQSHPTSPSPQHDQGLSSINGDEEATTACLRLVLKVVPHAAPELILSLIDKVTLRQKGVQRYSRDIINKVLEPNWEDGAGSCSRNTHCDTEMVVEAQQLAQPSGSGSIDDLMQRAALEELTSPYQDPWREVPIGEVPVEPAGEVLGTFEEDTVPGHCELPTQQPPYAIPAELPATAPTTNGRLQDFPGQPSPNVPPFNWQNPYGSSQLQPHRAATSPSVRRFSRATMQSHVPHDAVVSASFSGSRPDFQSDFVEQNAMGLDPSNYAQHEQLPTRKGKYPPAPYVSSASPSPPPQNRVRVTDTHSENWIPAHREHEVRPAQDARTGSWPSGRSPGYGVQRDAKVSPPPRRRDIATRQYDTSGYQRRRHRSSPVISEGMYRNVDPDEISRDQANRADGGVGSQGRRVHFLERSSQDEWDDDVRLGRVRDV